MTLSSLIMFKYPGMHFLTDPRSSQLKDDRLTRPAIPHHSMPRRFDPPSTRLLQLLARKDDDLVRSSELLYRDPLIRC